MTETDANPASTWQQAGIAPPLALIGSLLLASAVAALGGLATADSVDTWYDTIDKPSWTPPDWLFGPVWTVLYILMALAAWRALGRTGWPESRTAAFLYLAQLVVNLAWSLLFFGMRSPGIALVDILVLDVLVALTAWRFWQIDRLAGAALVPYLLWILFATALNVAIVVLN